MTVPRPAWAAEIKDWERFFEKHSDHGYHIFQQLCHYAAHSYQAFIRFERIWTINYIPSDLNVAGVDLAQGEEIAGFGGESVRHMIGKTYRCQSRAEEDFFLARWIAS
jgi:hypothetical protein